MRALRSIAMAFSCFSTIPMPTVDWSDENMRYMMAAFPLVGLVVGCCSCLWWSACDALGFSAFMRAVGLSLVPLAITGGIHMDGLADVIDARSSHADPARKREIMKDPHVGAFAIMGICSYLLAYVALATELHAELLTLYACSPIVSRCASAYMAVSWKGASSSGMFAGVSSTANKRVVQVVLTLVLLATASSLLWYDLRTSAFMLLAALVALIWVRRLSLREFGGMNGDLLGYFIQTSELAMLAAIVFAGRLF